MCKGIEILIKAVQAPNGAVQDGSKAWAACPLKVGESWIEIRPLKNILKD